MKQNWFENKIKELAKQSGYQKPEKFQDTLKLDSNENFVIPKQLQNDLINTAKKTSDIREYPLGGTERLIQALSKYLKIPTSMIGVGNGSDQILDLILANFASKQTKVLTSEVNQDIRYLNFLIFPRIFQDSESCFLRRGF